MDNDIYTQNESECESEVTQLCPSLCDPMDRGAYQAPLSMGFSRQEYWSGFPFPGILSQKRNEILPFATTRMDLEGIVLIDISSDRERQILYGVTYMWNLLQKTRRQWHPTPVLSLGESQGWRSLVGCSPWGR